MSGTVKDEKIEGTVPVDPPYACLYSPTFLYRPHDSISWSNFGVNMTNGLYTTLWWYHAASGLNRDNTYDCKAACEVLFSNSFQ